MNVFESGVKTVHVSSLSDIGLARKTNEDCHLVRKEDGLFVVADGMGGHLGGQRASQLAIEAIDKYFKSKEVLDNVPSTLAQALKNANAKVLQEAFESDNQGMGTTVTALKIVGSSAHIAHIGDSRAYLIRNKSLQLLTNDHSLVGELFRSGEITQEEAFLHPHRSVLIRALGVETDVDIDLIELELVPKDLLLLCTDGLSGLVRDKEILKIINEYSFHELAEKLVQKALQLGGLDNITVLLISYDGR